MLAARGARETEDGQEPVHDPERVLALRRKGLMIHAQAAVATAAALLVLRLVLP